MCLAIPGKVLEIKTDEVPRMGIAEFGGVKKSVCLEWVPEAAVGDYVIVHVGFAISKLDEKEALETLQIFKEMEELADGLDDGDELSTTPSGEPA